MKRAEAIAERSSPDRSRWWRDRAPLWVALAVQIFVAAWLCSYKLLALKQLVAGGRYMFVFRHLLATVDWAGALLGAIFLAAASFLPPQRWVDDLADWLGRNVKLVAAAVAVGFSALTLTAHHAYPLTMDEYAPYFQAQVFSRGHLAGQWPAELAPLLISPGHESNFIAVSKLGQAHSKYWPGHALLMTPFMALGIPWACNPVLSAGAILLFAAVARQSFGERAAGWAVLFALASPVFAAYGISFYAMTSHLALNLLYAFLLLSPTLARVAAAGCVGGFALVLHNPFPHFVFCLPWLGWLAARPDRWTRLPLIGLCYAATFLPLEIGWHNIEQSVRDDGPASLFSASVPAVAGAAEGGDPQPPAATGTAPAVSVVQSLLGYLSVFRLPSFFDFLDRRFSSALRLLAWDAPGLLPLACWAAWRCRRSTPARLFALSGLATFLGYGVVDLSGGHGWGYRYFFSAWSCLSLLVSSLAGITGASPADDGSDRRQEDSKTVAAVADMLRIAGLAAVLSLLICLPVRLWQIHTFIAEHLDQMPPLPPAAVAARGDVVRFLDPNQGWFRGDLIRNDPFFSGGPYVLVSQGLDQDRLVVEKLAESVGMRARMTFSDGRGSTWLVEPAPQESAP